MSNREEVEGGQITYCEFRIAWIFVCLQRIPFHPHHENADGSFQNTPWMEYERAHGFVVQTCPSFFPVATKDIRLKGL